MRAYNAMKRLGIAWMAALLVAASPTCNPEPTFWPSDLSGPPEWGAPCPAAVTDYVVYGRVTVYELTPLAGAEIRVNRFIDGAQTGAGMAMSDASGNYRIEVAGHADALRIYVIYPFGYEPWGVTSGGVPRGLDVIHWANPPASCGPIHWMASPKWTPIPSVTAAPSRTPTATLTRMPTWTPTATHTPTWTATPSITPTLTQTSIPTVTPTATTYAAGLPAPLKMTPASTQLELMQQHIILGVMFYNLAAGIVGACLVALAAMGFIKIKQK